MGRGERNTQKVILQRSIKLFAATFRVKNRTKTIKKNNKNKFHFMVLFPNKTRESYIPLFLSNKFVICKE